MNEEQIISWLLDSDPAIRWQVMKDIQDAEESIYSQERQKLDKEGWCAKLLRLQDKDGLWNASLYNGKWISTTYTLYLLKILGLCPFNDQALAACDQLLNQGVYKQREIRFSRTQEFQDLGVSGLILSMCCYFGYHQESMHGIAECLANQQCKASNWLPNDAEASVAYAFETTLIVLEALLQYRNRYLTPNRSLVNAEAKGQEYLLKHNLYLHDGKAIKSKWASFSFPPYWFYDVLTMLEYFRNFRKNKDERIQAGIDLVVKKRNKEGTWNLGSKHSGKTYFDMERVREPSRWNTLRAMRVLNWWKNGG
jgi:hypothetical protein